MKKKLAVLAFLLLLAAPAMAWAQTWYTGSKAIIAWDPVPPIVATDVVKYQAYTKVEEFGTPLKFGAETLATEIEITFTVEGRNFVGVETIRYVAGDPVGKPSERAAWSHNPLDCAGGVTFGVVFYVVPNVIKNLRIVK